MANRLLKPPEALTKQFSVALLALIAVIILWFSGWSNYFSPDPYVKSVITIDGDPVLGHSIFQINCTGCHGMEAQGRVGPSLYQVSKHKSRIALIKQVTSGKTPPMPQFHPNPQEMADLLSYLETL